MHSFILMLACISMILAAPISAQDFRKGLKAAQSGDFETALKEWTPLAEDGNRVAQNNPGVMYRNGWGVSQDYKEASKWSKLAAEQGHATAQTNLAVMYRNGEGILADFVTAHMWFNIAANNGNELAAENRKKLEKRITSEDTSKAQAKARVCITSNYEKCGY